MTHGNTCLTGANWVDHDIALRPVGALRGNGIATVCFELTEFEFGVPGRED